MATAKYSSEKKGTVIIEAKRGKLVLSPREADQVLADLQVMYHMNTLDIDYEDKKAFLEKGEVIVIDSIAREEDILDQHSAQFWVKD